MAQYVVHKIGFFYTDECFVAEVQKGTVMGITKSLEEAQAIKIREDIKSLKNAGGHSAMDFLFDNPDFDRINKKLEAFYNSEIKPASKDDRFDLPEKLTDEQAVKLLSVLELSFHNIVEYDDDEEIIADYEFDEEGGDIIGF